MRDLRGTMSRAKNTVGSVLAVFTIGAIAAFSGTNPEATQPVEDTPKSSVDAAVMSSFEHEADSDEMYFDCLADNPIECREADMLEESGCYAHKLCIDRCLDEGAGHLCYADCDAMYLGVGSLDPEVDVCGCELCMQACSEQCYCENYL